MTLPNKCPRCGVLLLLKAGQVADRVHLRCEACGEQFSRRDRGLHAEAGGYFATVVVDRGSADESVGPRDANTHTSERRAIAYATRLWLTGLYRMVAVVERPSQRLVTLQGEEVPGYTR